MQIDKTALPQNVQRLSDHEHFAFHCHGRISCFTHCCRQLELALTPYDVLRLKNLLDMNSTDFLDRYVIIEQEEKDPFPRFYLTMQDDGEDSCIFVAKEGCTVYQDRPGACRAYPLGRASMRGQKNPVDQFYVLIQEDHCRGFAEKLLQTPLQYSTDQGLDRYNTFNDALIPILQHDNIRQGMRLTPSQLNDFILALYDLDRFRDEMISEAGPAKALVPTAIVDLGDDEQLLLVAIDWLTTRLFPHEQPGEAC